MYQESYGYENKFLSLIQMIKIAFRVYLQRGPIQPTNHKFLQILISG